MASGVMGQRRQRGINRATGWCHSGDCEEKCDISFYIPERCACYYAHTLCIEKGFKMRDDPVKIIAAAASSPIPVAIAILVFFATQSDISQVEGFRRWFYIGIVSFYSLYLVGLALWGYRYLSRRRLLEFGWVKIEYTDGTASDEDLWRANIEMTAYAARGWEMGDVTFTDKAILVSMRRAIPAKRPRAMRVPPNSNIKTAFQRNILHAICPQCNQLIVVTTGNREALESDLRFDEHLTIQSILSGKKQVCPMSKQPVEAQHIEDAQNGNSYIITL